MPVAVSATSSYFSFERIPGQLPELDGLRGLAVIFVLLRHASRPFWSTTEPLLPLFGWDFGRLLINGWIGVDLFFVLSGFLITHHILKLRARVEGPWPWKTYLSKRALRIVPAYYAVIFLAVLGAFPGFDVGDELLGIRVTYHLLFLQDYLPANIVVAFWSLGVEEKFYLIAPFLVLACAAATTLRARIAGIAAVGGLGLALRLVTAMNHPEIDSYDEFFYVFRSPFHMTMDPILMGVVLALIYRSREEAPRLTGKPTARAAFWIGLVLLGWLTAGGAMMDSVDWWDKTLQPTAIALAFASITFGLLFGGGPAAFFHTAVLRFFARISYSLYLIHLPLIPLALWLTAELGGPDASFGLFLPIFATLSVFAALVLHFAVEKPFLLLKDRIPARTARAPELSTSST
jgi:peptidoglycan/LPS O-acetylase OafA/YrhL